MDAEVKVRARPPAIALTRRREVRLAEIGPVIQASFGEVYGYLGARDVAPLDPPFLIYHGRPGPADEPFEIEICAPIARRIEPPDGWLLTELPAGTFASTVHVGPYSELRRAYDRLDDWLRTQGYAQAGPPREVYLSPASTPPELTRTVIEYPVEMAMVATSPGR